MVKIQKISEIEPRLGFTEFDMLKKYRQSFATSELGRLHALFPFSELARQMHLKSSALGRKSYFSPEGRDIQYMFLFLKNQEKSFALRELFS